MKDVQVKNIVTYTTTVLISSIQLIIIIAFILSFFPIQINDFVKMLLPLYWDQVRPEREMQLYAIFIILNVIGQAAGMLFLRKQLADDAFALRLRDFIFVLLFWVLLELTFVFKFFAFGNAMWAKWSLGISILLSTLCMIFLPEIKRFLKKVNRWVSIRDNCMMLRRSVDILLPILAISLIWPDFNKLLAHIFVWDYFYHLDFFIMAPGWAFLKGQLLNIDINSTYNVCVAALFAIMAKLFGGFTYENVLRLIVMGTFAYYVGVYVFLRFWSKSVLLAAFGFLLFIKLQMFHWGVVPVVWRYPSATPIRYLFDLLPIFFICKHAFGHKEKYLWLAAVATGFMMGYMLEVGVYLTLAFYAYGFMLMTLPSTRKMLYRKTSDVRTIIGLCLLPLITAAVVLWIVQGVTLWSSEFWSNSTELARLFLNGFYSLPLWDSLKDKQFFAVCMGFVIPAVYVLTMMIIGAMVYLQRTGISKIFIVYLCVYGLGMYHYFIYRSGVTSYYVVSLPFVLVICFWVSEIALRFSQNIRRISMAILVFLTFGSLTTGYLFTVYPNSLNLAGVDYASEIQSFKKGFVFDQDAALIKRIMPEDQPVPLISSFETKILMEANRKAFFYYTPLIASAPMEGLDFQRMELYTYARLQNVLKQVELSKPEYVFFEKKLCTGQLRPEYYQHYQTLTAIIQYVAARYEPYAQGQYLLALKRKKD